MGSLHGGAIFAVMDYITTATTIAAHPNLHLNVSADINMSYHIGAPSKSDIYLISEATKVGKRLAFSECSIYGEKQELLYRGHQTHAILNEVFVVE